MHLDEIYLLDPLRGRGVNGEGHRDSKGHSNGVHSTLIFFKIAYYRRVLAPNAVLLFCYSAIVNCSGVDNLNL